MHYCYIIVDREPLTEARIDELMEPFDESIDIPCACDEDDDCPECDNTRCIGNPIGAWDWFEIGGRWNGMFRDKTGAKVNTCRKSDLMPEAEARRLNLQEMLEIAAKEGWKKKQIQSSTDRINNLSPWGSYGFLQNGALDSVGGSFFASMEESKRYEEEWRKYWDTIPEDHYLAVVDCHL